MLWWLGVGEVKVCFHVCTCFLRLMLLCSYALIPLWNAVLVDLAIYGLSNCQTIRQTVKYNYSIVSRQSSVVSRQLSIVICHLIWFGQFWIVICRGKREDISFFPFLLSFSFFFFGKIKRNKIKPEKKVKFSKIDKKEQNKKSW